MDKKLQKNTLWIKGQSNAGKSLIMNSLGRSCRFYVTLNEVDYERARYCCKCEI